MGSGGWLGKGGGDFGDVGVGKDSGGGVTVNISGNGVVVVEQDGFKVVVRVVFDFICIRCDFSSDIAISGIGIKIFVDL